MRVLVLVVLVALVAPAAAGPEVPPGVAPERVVIVHKNPAHARMLAIFGTLSAVGVAYGSAKFGDVEGDVMKGFAGAFVIWGPAWGAWDADDRPVLTLGMGLRAASLAVGGLGVGVDTKCNAVARMTGGGSTCTGTTREHASDTMIGLGVALLAAGTVYDIIDAGRRARERRFIVVPTASATSAGVSVAASF